MRAESSEFATLARRYLVLLEARGRSRRTVAIQARGLSLFLNFLARGRPLEPAAVRPDDIQAFAADALTRPVPHAPGRTYHPNTLANWMGAVRGLFRWLVVSDRLLLDPTLGLPPVKIPRPLPRVLTLAEVDRLLAVPCGDTPADLRARAILELLYSSGLRCGELLALDVTDIDLASREVHVRRGKGGRSRRVPLGGAAAHALRAYLDQGRPLLASAARPTSAIFLSSRGNRFSPVLTARMVRRHARDAHLAGHVTAHTLRHTAALHLLRGGADLRYVQVFLGHRKATTSAHYTRLVLADLKHALARCHPRHRLGV